MEDDGNIGSVGQTARGDDHLRTKNETRTRSNSSCRRCKVVAGDTSRSPAITACRRSRWHADPTSQVEFFLTGCGALCVLVVCTAVQ